MCNDNNNDGNSPSSSCGSLRQLYSNNGKASASSSASASTDDGTDDDNLDRPDNHDRPNHDVVMNHQNKDNHRNGGGGHQSKDDTPFSLPFP
jgi:hypothetical protein